MKITSIPPVFLSVYFLLFNFQLIKGQAGVSNKEVENIEVKDPKIKWSTNPFDHQVFIENKGQFDGIFPGKEKVLYGVQLGKIWAYFTEKGIKYRYVEYPKADKDSPSNDPDKEEVIPPTTHYVSSTWEGVNPSVEIECVDKQSYYYTYSSGNNTTIKTEVFKKIIYRNIYPGIDVEYYFPKGKPGIEYSIIVHPKGDLSKLKLSYSGGGRLKINNAGDVILNSEIGEITEHAPVGSYNEELGNVPVCYTIHGLTESYKINGNYDKSKTLIIDPWVTNPNFTKGCDRVYDVCYDNHGNVYAYGGTMPCQLVKLNSAGVVQWMYTAVPFTSLVELYGGFTVDKKTGTSYLIRGFCLGGPQVLKVNTLGNLLATCNGSGRMNEMWRIAYNSCSDNIVVGGGGTGDTNQACMLDTTLSKITPIPVVNTFSSYHDISLLCIDPSGLTCYMALSRSTNDKTHYNNVFFQLPIPALRPATYVMPDFFGWWEGSVARYVINSFPDPSNGFNGMAASPNWLYLYSGVSLKQYNKNTGVLHDSIAISDTTGFWSGLDVNACDDIFLGCHDSVKCYNSSLALQSSIVMPDSVYCLVLGKNNLLYVGGNAFVSAVTVPALPKLLSVITSPPSSCRACDGTATANINCGTAPFTYHWSNGTTNQVDSGLCGGTYTVIVTDAACPPHSDTAVANISGTPGYKAATSDTNPNCGKKGNATVHVIGGNAPYTYKWSNGATNQTDSGLVAGTYTCVVTDSSGCKCQANITLIFKGSVLSINVTPTLDSICIGSTITIKASGANKYSWSPASALSCSNCPNPIASPTVTTTYTVTGIDSAGCKGTATSTIKVKPLPIISISPISDTICLGGGVVVTASGAMTYKWTPTTGLSCTTCNSPTATPTVTTTYTVTGTDPLGCSSSASVTIYLRKEPTIDVTAAPTSICEGESTTLTASINNATGPFIWQPGAITGSTISVTPTVTTAYTVTVSAGCGLATGVKTVHVNQLPVTEFQASVTAGCTPLCIQFFDRTRSADRISQWRWNFGNGDTLNIQNPIYCYNKPGNYTVSLNVVTDSGCSAMLSSKNYISAYPSPSADFSFSPQTTTILQPTIQFNDISTDSYGIAYRLWNFGEPGDTISNLQNPIHTYRDTGTFRPTLIVMDNHGCLDTITSCLVIDPIFALYIPSAFTPNGDRKNEIFIPKGNDIKTFEMYIFDRWGMLLFHSHNIMDGWDGRFKGLLCQEDTYVYHISVSDSKNNLHSYTGGVTLLK